MSYTFEQVLNFMWTVDIAILILVLYKICTEIMFRFKNR